MPSLQSTGLDERSQLLLPRSAHIGKSVSCLGRESVLEQGAPRVG